LEGPLPNTVFYADRKSKMAVTAGHRLTLDPMGKCSNAFFSETTNMIKTKFCRSRHFEFHIGTKNVKFVEDHPMNILYSLALIIFVVSEKKAFEHFYEIQNGGYGRT
jgi:hypothetical protein